MASVLNRLSLRLSSGLSGPKTLLLLLLVFSTQVLAASVNLAWDPVTSGSLRGYMVYYGPALGSPLTNPVQGADTKVDVGNNTTYTVPNLVAGTTYRFAVTAYDAGSVESGFSNQVSTTVASSLPVAQFTGSTTSGIAPLAMNFLNTSTGNISTYAWTFGDGTTSAVQSPSHVYAAAGSYSVSLTVNGPGGSNTQTRSNYVTVTAPPTSAPVAAFAANITSGIAPLAVNFTSNSTGNIATYAWSFGDGTGSSTPNPAHVYSSPGVYTVRLTVTGPGGTNTQTRSNYVTVTAPPPVAEFGSNVSLGVAPLTVNFISRSTGNIARYAWDLGNSTTSTQRNPSRVYSSPGVYTVSLTVTGPRGSNTMTKTNYVTVTAPPSSSPPVAAFAANVTSGVAPLTVNFASSSTGSITTYAWSFGDGTASSTQNPAHVYSSPGVYTVSLTVSGLGGTDTKTSTGYITATPSTPTGCPCSLWEPGTVPVTAADPDTAPVELGVKFKSDLSGLITGIRYYKSSSNTGTHIGSLWASDGTLLARATFTSETASGWQQVEFTTPVAITANTVYVASYHTNVGRYAGDDSYFSAKGVDNGPLHALRDLAGQNNGVYSYGANPTFPGSSYRATNYWVDVIFSAQ